MLVCRTWHSTLTPFLWRDFSWYSPAYHKRNPADTQILTNARHIQTLTIRTPAGPTPPLLSMPSHLIRLTSLHLPFLSSEVLQAIQHCREMLVAVALATMDGSSGQIFTPASSEVIAFWDLIAACPRLTSLELPDTISSSHPTAPSLFIKVLQQLTTLNLGLLRPGTLLPPPIHDGYPAEGFPIRNLTVNITLLETNLLFITELFARCHGLARL